MEGVVDPPRSRIIKMNARMVLINSLTYLPIASCLCITKQTGTRNTVTRQRKIFATENQQALDWWTKIFNTPKQI